jgi:hypothetical protein
MAAKVAPASGHGRNQMADDGYRLIFGIGE